MPAPDHRLGFTTQERERTATPLPVEGALPGWLRGTLIRNGPAKFEAGVQRYRHWFDGLAMLHRFAVRDGEVTYASRFLDSPAYRAARSEGRIAYAEFATDPCRSLFQRVASVFRPPAFGDNANVNVVRWGDDVLAMTETPLPVRFDPQTLETVGVGTPAPGQLTVAHPHLAPKTGELVSYATQLGPRSSYRIFAQAPGQTARRAIASVPVSRPAYMHSFAITERYAVLVEFPFVVFPAAIPLSGRPFIDNFRWKPERGTRLQVVDLDTGALQGTYEAAPLFSFHHVNAFERDGELLIDLCAYDDAQIVQSLFLNRLRTPSPHIPVADLRRLRVPLRGGGDARTERLSATGPELPRIDYRRCNGRPYRVVYGNAPAQPGAFLDTIVKVDVESGETVRWAQAGTFPGEPVFVPRPDRADGAQDDGVLLSVVLDPAAGASFLLVLDAATLTEVARATAPQHVPFGFHGQFFADAPG